MLLPGCIINAGKVQQYDGFRGFSSLHSAPSNDVSSNVFRATISLSLPLTFPSCFIGGGETISNLSSASGPAGVSE